MLTKGLCALRGLQNDKQILLISVVPLMDWHWVHTSFTGRLPVGAVSRVTVEIKYPRGFPFSGPVLVPWAAPPPNDLSRPHLVPESGQAQSP